MSNFVRLSRLKLRFKKNDQQTMSKHNTNGCMLELRIPNIVEKIRNDTIIQ